MRQQCAMAPQLNPRHHEKVRGGSKAARRRVTNTDTSNIVETLYSEAWGKGKLHVVYCSAQGKPGKRSER